VRSFRMPTPAHLWRTILAGGLERKLVCRDSDDDIPAVILLLVKTRSELKRFEREDRSHFPVAELNLRKDENLYVYKGKERPAIILGAVKSRFANPLYDERLFLCAPIFSFKTRHQDFFKIECLGFVRPNLFYLPPVPDGCAESVIRFEHVQGITPKALRSFFSGMPSRPVALSNEAFALFLNHLGRFLFKRDFDTEACANTDAYRELVDEQLRQVKKKN
jgi:hypothetical protein